MRYMVKMGNEITENKCYMMKMGKGENRPSGVCGEGETTQDTLQGEEVLGTIVQDTLTHENLKKIYKYTRNELNKDTIEVSSAHKVKEKLDEYRKEDRTIYNKE